MLQGEKAWHRCKEGKNWSLLLGVLITSYFWYIVGSVFLHLVSTAAGFAFPLLLEAITQYLELCGAAAVRIWLAPRSRAQHALMFLWLVSWREMSADTISWLRSSK